jgi:D-hexose-6-phosphate mutarotase
LIDVVENVYGETNIELRLSDSALDEYKSYKGLLLTLKITLGDTLKIYLETANASNTCISYSEGLHTYFAVSDIKNIKITGLEGQSYLDLMNNNRETCDDSPIKFDRETGRIYVNSESECIIEDANLNRKIRVQKWGSMTTAIWNPWASGVKKLNDMEADGWRDMVCVESANAYVNHIDLNGKDTHTLVAEYILEV